MNKLQERLNPQDLDHFVVLEGGAAYGIGYEFGILDEFRDQGVDFSDTDMLGTSAGSWVAGALATRLTFEQVADQPQIELFNQTPNYMRGYAREIFGDQHAGNVNATATLFPSMQLHIRNGGEGKHQLADLVAPSSSVPGLFAPARADGKLWWDGAVAGLSMGYAHEAPKAQTLVVIGALAKHLQAPVPLGPLGKVPGLALEMKSRRDWGRWQDNNPNAKVIYVRPNRKIGSKIKEAKDLFDFDIARDVYHMAREQASEMFDVNSEHYRHSIASLAVRNTLISA